MSAHAHAAVPWSLLIEQLPQFNRVLFFELTCSCGDWRSAVPIDSESIRLSCPRCGELHRPFFLGHGLVQTTVPWVLVSPSLSRNRNVRLCRPRTGRPKAREVTARVLRTVNLMVQGKTAPEIARELRLSSSHYNLFVRRRKTDIDAELRRITINSCAQEARGGANRNSVIPECHAI
jgi:hypothetical protein